MLRPYMRVCGCAMVGWGGCDCKTGGEARHSTWIGGVLEAVEVDCFAREGNLLRTSAHT